MWHSSFSYLLVRCNLKGKGLKGWVKGKPSGPFTYEADPTSLQDPDWRTIWAKHQAKVSIRMGSAWVDTLYTVMKLAQLIFLKMNALVGNILNLGKQVMKNHMEKNLLDIVWEIN